jgi:hypothetical protein
MEREPTHIVTPIFAFYYKEGGGIAGNIYERNILFESLSGNVISFDKPTNTSISVMQLDSMKQNNLQESILRNKFFEAETYYPGEGPDNMNHLLTITMNDMSRTVYWNTFSKIPEDIGLNEIAGRIRTLVTK